MMKKMKGDKVGSEKERRESKKENVVKNREKMMNDEIKEDKKQNGK